VKKGIFVVVCLLLFVGAHCRAQEKPSLALVGRAPMSEGSTLAALLGTPIEPVAPTTATTAVATTMATTKGETTAEKVSDYLGRLNKGRSGSYGLYAIVALTVLSLAPAILILVTSFARIIIVLHFLRHALGLQEVPPNQVLMGLALFLTVLSMHGVIGQVHDGAIIPFLDGEMAPIDALGRAQQPLRAFMLGHVREEDLSLFVESSRMPAPASLADVSLSVIVPAFVVNELRIAFQIGLLIFVPFLVIDLVVAVVLTSAGLTSLPSSAVALPFKVLLFVLIDGWALVVGALLKSIVV